MTLLRFTLSEEGVSAFHDALACLNKFSEEVSLEAEKDKVRFVLKHPTFLPLDLRSEADLLAPSWFSPL